MRLYILLALLSFCFQSSYCQRKVVVIDTLHSVVDDSRLSMVLAINCDSTIRGVIADETLKITIDRTKYPNVVVTGLNEECVRLLLDDKNGYCRIEKITCDTVAIHKWTIYDCGLSDAEMGNVAYWHYNNDSGLGTPFRVKPVKTKIRNSGMKKLGEILVVINGQQYTAQVVNAADSLVKSFHGYTPYKRYLRYTAKGKKNKNNRLSYFHGEVMVTKCHFSSKIVLKDN